MHLSHDEFEQIVSQAIDAIPDRYFENLKNVAFVIENNPSLEQRQKLNLRGDQTLFGLYEGIPLTKRTNNYSFVLPDKITIFKEPIESIGATKEDISAQVHKTVWHEVAHYFGLDHDKIDALENKNPSSH